MLGWAVAGLAPATALLLGAILAPTDPVLAADVQVGEPSVDSPDGSPDGRLDGRPVGRHIDATIILPDVSSTDDPERARTPRTMSDSA